MSNQAPNGPSGYGGIYRSLISGTYHYTAIPGRESMPVNNVTWFEAVRFANWMNNGQGNGDTETGAYTLLGGTATPSNGATVSRNPGAAIFLPSEDEWYKAAYYDGSTSSYFALPTRSNILPTCTTPTAAPNSANCEIPGNLYPDLTPVGSYPGSTSPYGTFDQGGNVEQWNETIVGPGCLPQCRGARGGSFDTYAFTFTASSRYGGPPDTTFYALGFRLAMIDRTPPTITSLVVNPTSIWPPNHEMIPIAVTVNATDDSGKVSCKIVSVTSNEPAAGQFQITGGLTASLEAARNGGGSGRVYAIEVQCTDPSNNAADALVEVNVPRDQASS